MTTYTGYAVVGVAVETQEPYLLAASAELAVAEEAFKHFRQLLTVVAAQGELNDSDYAKVMNSIRTMKIITVSVVETEVL